MKNRWVTGALLTLLALFPLAVGASEPPLEFVIEDIDGATVDLGDYRGEWVVVNFWATWCKPCRKEIPDLDALHREREDVCVIGLAFEEVGPAEIRRFLEEVPASYPMALVDIYEPPETFGAPMVLPTTVIVDPQGRKARTILGPVTREEIERFIDNQDTEGDT